MSPVSFSLDAFSKAVESPVAFLSADPSDRLDFSCPPAGNLIRFDTRDDATLKFAISNGMTSSERERALWEYADRHGAAGLDIISSAAENDPDPAVRCSTLWLIQKVAGLDAEKLLRESEHDEHVEVRDWVHMLCYEIADFQNRQQDDRPLKRDDANPFDQTLPLFIAGYARVFVPSIGCIQATLSPLWFESIMGRVMACTVESSFKTELIIEKAIRKYHPDGSDHFEIYKFRGISQELTQDLTLHYYEGRSAHPFYPSGKVENQTCPPYFGDPVNVNRMAITARRASTGGDRRRVVDSVRGRYVGFAYTDITRILHNGMQIGPAEIQLTNPHDKISGPLTNTWLFGTFKGKLSDLDGDGLLDVNTERCHATLDGQLDTDLDGKPDTDIFAV